MKNVISVYSSFKEKALNHVTTKYRAILVTMLSKRSSVVLKNIPLPSLRDEAVQGQRGFLPEVTAVLCNPDVPMSQTVIIFVCFAAVMKRMLYS